LALALTVVELEAVHGLPELARGEGSCFHAAVLSSEINFISVNFLLDDLSVPRYSRMQASNSLPLTQGGVHVCAALRPTGRPAHHQDVGLPSVEGRARRAASDRRGKDPGHEHAEHLLLH